MSGLLERIVLQGSRAEAPAIRSAARMRWVAPLEMTPFEPSLEPSPEPSPERAGLESEDEPAAFVELSPAVASSSPALEAGELELVLPGGVRLRWKP